MRMHSLFRKTTKRSIYVSMFVATLVILGAYCYIIMPHAPQPAGAKYVACASEVGGNLGFERGYFDGLVTIRPEVSTVTIKPRESTMVKLLITYQRREPTPEAVELRFGSNLSAMYIPRDQNSTPADLRTYLRVNDYVRYEPEVVKAREGETAEVWVIFEFKEEFLSALDHNRFSGHTMPLPIDVYISDNNVTIEAESLWL